MHMTLSRVYFYSTLGSYAPGTASAGSCAVASPAGVATGVDGEVAAGAGSNAAAGGC